ncbi:hypothetical protein N7491_010742 [Penicillium cf. griseofulvum]|uniref:Uncharacterized protein n=1 Tax=Penicillium cf. griseofulvum TaxID=2972120 RepID=A0A9W9N0I4_9EURO|nr:hypothetical protein N7472_001066 [Penicillium cf. griseofulvum]KAJ5422297.1 hypothetical protein N7491_010742 [Penicillium cf. griseofulvum]KAJ5428480.1 hypothetical protein N7445_009934 [Penicillium cf. griseofulvum]
MAVLSCFDSYSPGSVVEIPATSTYPVQQWVIDEKMSEDLQHMTKYDVLEGLGPSFAAAKFYCHRPDLPERGIMRIYLQFPDLGTELTTQQARANQAIPSPRHPKIEAFKTPQKHDSQVAPKLIVIHQGKQNSDSPIHGASLTI